MQQAQTQTQVQMHNRRFYNYVLKNENNEADIMLYGNIGEVVGYDDITDQEIVKQINDLGNVSKINLRINSLEVLYSLQLQFTMF